MLAADACESQRARRARARRGHRGALRSLLPPEASVRNPVDMIASATARHYGEVVRALGAAPEVDALIVVFNTPLSPPLRMWPPSSLPPVASSPPTCRWWRCS